MRKQSYTVWKIPFTQYRWNTRANEWSVCIFEARFSASLSPGPVRVRFEVHNYVCHKQWSLSLQKVIFGVNSAPETYQRIIQQVIQDIPGCKNIIDDIIIYASNQQEHDKILRMLLTRLREKGLTLNRNKCEIQQIRIEIYGSHTFKLRHKVCWWQGQSCKRNTLTN